MQEIHSQFSLDDILRWRRLLKQRKKAVLETEKSLKRRVVAELSTEDTGEMSKTRLHAGDLATNTQEIETLESLSETNIKKVQEIDAALIRLDNGKFGVCESCQEPISKKRLDSIPEARFCLECEQDQEAMEKQINLNKADMRAQLPAQTVAALSELKVSDIMQERPVTLNMNETVDVAANLLSENKFRHLPVVDKDGNIQGIISDRDLLLLALRIRPWELLERVENEWFKNRIRNVMTKTPETVTPETSLFEAGTILLENKISCLPVVEGNRLVGIITESDFVKLVGELSQS